MPKTKIAGVGMYVPKNVYTNHDMMRFMDTSDEWIQERTGIIERRFAERNSETTATMGIEAAKLAIEDAGITPREVDFIVFATVCPDYYFPGFGVLVQRAMHMKDIGALDVRNQCSGFIYALSVGDQFVRSGTYKNVLVIGSEKQSFAGDFTTRGRKLAVLFGDGAGAVLLQPTDEENSGILSCHLHSDGSGAEALACFNPGTHSNHWVKSRVLADYDEAEIGKQYVQQKMTLTDDEVYVNIQRYGNTTAASIPIALYEAEQEGKIKTGDLVCLASFGSGLTWASTLIKW